MGTQKQSRLSRLRYHAVRLAVAGLLAFMGLLPADVARAQTPKRSPAPLNEFGVLAATDASWQIDGKSPAILVTDCIHPFWLRPEKLGPAKWIWAQHCTASDDEAHTFSTSFSVTGTSGLKVELDIVVDNYAFVSVNGQRVGCVDGFSAAATLDVSKYVHPGSNQIGIEVHNLAVGFSPGWSNPAGLLARLRTLGAPSKGKAPGANDRERP